MISRIARKELTEMLRDGRFRLLAGMVLAISVLSLGAGWKSYAELRRQHALAQTETREQWLNQDKKNPHSAAHYGVYAFKPKSQLAMVDTGIDPYVGVAAWLEAHKQNEFKFRPAQDRTAVQRFGEMTGAEVLQVLLPLFIVLMTFAAFAGEREQGTLRQLLSIGVSRRDLALGKALGVAADLAIVLVPATVLAVVALALSSENGLVSGDPARGVLLGLVYLAYFALMIAVSLAVSARARSSRLALVALLCFWFFNSLVASRAASDLAGWLYPTPSAVDFQRAMDVDLNNEEEMRVRLDKRRADLLKQYGVANVDALPIAFNGVSMQEGEEHANEVFDKHFGQLFDRYEEQNRVYQVGGAVAPLLSVRALSMGLSGTDFQQHRHFTTAAETYRRGIQRLMNGDIAANQKKGQVYLADQSLWAQLPEFEYAAPGTGWVLRHYTASMAVLLLWTLVAMAFMLRSATVVRAD
ncbi:MAG: ABC transporter permease [Acidimicrobiia bacterium]